MERIAERFEHLAASVGAYSTLIVIAILAGTSRTILSTEQRTFGAYIRMIVIAGFVGFIASQFMKDVALSEGTKGAIVGVAAFIANDILRALLVIGEMLANDPIGTISKLRGLRSLRGGKDDTENRG